MPTPHELEVAKRQDVLRRHGNDFYVQEVVELMDSDDTAAGEEDLPRDARTSARGTSTTRSARDLERREEDSAGATDESLSGADALLRCSQNGTTQSAASSAGR